MRPGHEVGERHDGGQQAFVRFQRQGGEALVVQADGEGDRARELPALAEVGSQRIVPYADQAPFRFVGAARVFCNWGRMAL